LFKDLYTADPATLVHDGRLYLYTGHDNAPRHHRNYLMDDWYVFSTDDLVHWTTHGPALSVRDFSWANGNAWASQAIERDGKLYWYVCVDHRPTHGMAIGVAVADRPEGPYHDALGKPLITTDMTPFPNQPAWTWDDIDPTVFVDDDGQAYLYFGNSRLKYVKLNRDMISLDGPIVNVEIPRVEGLSFTEAPWLYKAQGRYYLAYAAGWEEQLAYCVSDSPTGPWTPGGKIAGHSKNSNTTHPAIVEFQGQWLLFTHDGSLPGGDSWHRSVGAYRLHYGPDGTLDPLD
jgi:beta-xylosidase